MARNKRPTHEQYRLTAKRLFHEEGKIEIDDRTRISAPGKDGDDGVYVQAWVWVSAEDARKHTYVGIGKCGYCGHYGASCTGDR